MYGHRTYLGCIAGVPARIRMPFVDASAGAICFLMLSVSTALAIDCPEPPKQIAQDVEGNIRGELQGIIGKILSAQAGGEIKTITNNLFENYPNADRLVIVNGIMSIYCQVIDESAELSDREKLEAIGRMNLEILNFINPPSIDEETKSKIEDTRRQVTSITRDLGNRWLTTSANGVDTWSAGFPAGSTIRSFGLNCRAEITTKSQSNDMYYQITGNDAVPVVGNEGESVQISIKLLGVPTSQMGQQSAPEACHGKFIVSGVDSAG